MGDPWLGRRLRPGMTAVTTIVRIHQILVARVEEALAPFGLSFARFEILRLLGFTRTGRLPMGKISDRLQVHPASVTSAVKRLEREGLLHREAGHDDSRVVLAAILPKGRRAPRPGHGGGERCLREHRARIRTAWRALSHWSARSGTWLATSLNGTSHLG